MLGIPAFKEGVPLVVVLEVKNDIQQSKKVWEMYFGQAQIEGSETVSFWYILVEIFLFTDYLLLNTIDFRIRESR